MYCELNLYQICKIIQLILKYIKQRMLEFQLEATKKKVKIKRQQRNISINQETGHN